MSMVAGAVAGKVSAVTSNWWLLLLRGALAVVVGFIALSRPGDALVALVMMLGFYAFVVGIIAVYAAIAGSGGDHWWALLLEGILGMVAALIIWSWPTASALTFVYFVAAWMVITGIFQIAAGIKLRDVVGNEWLYILSGVVSTLFGIWVFRSGNDGVLGVGLLLAWYFMVYGFLQIAVAVRLRSVHGSLTPQTS